MAAFVGNFVRCETVRRGEGEMTLNRIDSELATILNAGEEEQLIAH